MSQFFEIRVLANKHGYQSFLSKLDRIGWESGIYVASDVEIPYSDVINEGRNNIGMLNALGIYKCDECGEYMLEGETYDCYECDNIVCQGCVFFCDECDESLCCDCAYEYNAEFFCITCYNDKEREESLREVKSEKRFVLNFHDV